MHRPLQPANSCADPPTVRAFVPALLPALLPVTHPAAGFTDIVSEGQQLQISRYLATGAEGGSLYLRVSGRLCSWVGGAAGFSGAVAMLQLGSSAAA